MKMRIVVVGNGMVGHHFLSQLGAEQHSVTLLASEASPAYDRVHLSELFSGKTADELALGTPQQYQELGIDAFFGDPVVSIDRDARRVSTASGNEVQYDKLVLATGSYPFVPPIKGNDHPRCLVYRTLDDLEAIRTAAAGGKTGVVVGGGLLGLECANALQNLGLETHVVEFGPGLMGVQLDAEGSATLQYKIEDLGITVHTNTATQSITSTEGNRLLMQFAEDNLTTDLIVFSAGIRPHDELARDSQIEIAERGGIAVNEHCLTCDPNIYAIGECASWEGRIFGLVAPGYRMAEAAAGHLNGKSVTFRGADMSTKLKLLGVDVGSIGDAHGNTEGALAYQFHDPVRRIYKRLNVSPDGKQLLGAVLVGDCDAYDAILQYHLNELELPESPEALILPQSELALPGPDELPASATICSCLNVSKGQIVHAVANGYHSIGAVKAETGASKGCGGCGPLLKTVVDQELASLGVSVDKSLCPHFAQDRQGIFHICQVEGIRTFEELLAKHGRGGPTSRGCDVCKPAVASILAALWNEYVLDKKHAGLQDTNDARLANMQKNGTYSVVPRIPGGEITPEKLIAIGEVAKRYDLYTKITGGQRIDLFGAQLHELPLIWRELIDAGFETGHAYGKALRTVKSCVGSTWCRYGVQDSVAMALYIENRYKGLRSPHKLKMAVSGCARECAEARSKDVGVIATENGWNLYVCGNGGMRPRHADLFATDLDDQTLIRYIDRILMFYVRTAERLQRTSVWMEGLEGGLDYLREVIADDKLGLGDELEAQMANIIGTYQCEWKTTLEDPDRLKRFRPFVNTTQSNEQIVFVRERGQRRPATEEELKADIVLVETGS